jgi:putative FmdB family regulatory protein
MPLYEYRCEACGQQFEAIRKFSDAALDTCILCGSGPVQRLLSSPAIQFKGSGWYITDYAQKGKTGSEAGSEATGTSKETASKPATGDGASDTKTETTTPAAKPAATK